MAISRRMMTSKILSHSDMENFNREIIALKHMMNIMEEREPKKTLTARSLIRREIMILELAMQANK